jgi:tetratricopeptide (TPR) repeat protein
MQFAQDDFIDDRFKVFRVVEGGIGVVYLCLDTHSINFAALKTLKPTANPTQVRNFQKAAVLAIQIGRHPNVVWHRNFFEVGDYPFLEMEWIPAEQERGTELADWVALGALELRVALDLAIDICEGMKFALSKGLRVHRDLKPENILIGAGPNAKITDFGIALSTDDNLAVDGGIGTPFYMAPEQWQHTALNDLDERTDIYAVGCILYEMVTGKKPFFSEDYEALRNMHLKDSPSFEGHTLPEALPTIILKAMAKSVGERYSNFGTFQQDLRHLYQTLYEEEPSIHAAEAMSTDELYNRALLFLRINRYEDAIADFTRALASEPQSAVLHSNRAFAFMQLDRRDEALADVQQAVLLDPDETSVQYLAGLVCRYFSLLDEAFKHLEIVLHNDPNHVNARLNLALVQWGQGQANEAIGNITRVINQGQESAVAFLIRADIYIDALRYEDAVRDYTRALSFDSQDDSLYAKRGNAFLYLAKYKEGLNDFDRALRLNPEPALYYAYRGRAYKLLNLYHEALLDMEIALERNYVGSEVFRDRAEIFMQSRMYTRALEDIQNVLENDSQNAIAYRYHGTILSRMEKYDEALESFNRAIALAQEDKGNFAARSLFYYLREEYNLALLDINMAMSLDIKDYELHFIRGNILLALDRANEAVSAYSTAIALYPTFSASYNNRGICQLHLQRYAEALSDFNMALNYNPYMLQPRINIGMIFEAQNQLAFAIQEYTTVAYLGNPQGIELLRKLGKDHHLQFLLPEDPIDSLRRAMLEAHSLEQMRLIVRKYPYLLDEAFEKAMPEIFSPEELTLMQDNKQLYWFRLSVAELFRN